MNYYAEVVELCSKEQDWKAIAINVAKKHPKIFLDAAAANFVSWETEARELYLGQGELVKAIKYCRSMTGMSLKDAKEAVEALA